MSSVSSAVNGASVTRPFVGDVGGAEPQLAERLQRGDAAQSGVIHRRSGEFQRFDGRCGQRSKAVAGDLRIIQQQTAELFEAGELRDGLVGDHGVAEIQVAQAGEPGEGLRSDVANLGGGEGELLDRWKRS